MKRVTVRMSEGDYLRYRLLADHHRRTLSQQILASLDSSYRSSQKYLPPPTDPQFNDGWEQLTFVAAETAVS